MKKISLILIGLVAFVVTGCAPEINPVNQANTNAQVDQINSYIKPTEVHGHVELTIAHGQWNSGAGYNDILVIHDPQTHTTVTVHDKDQIDSYHYGAPTK